MLFVLYSDGVSASPAMNLTAHHWRNCTPCIERMNAHLFLPTHANMSNEHHLDTTCNSEPFCQQWLILQQPCGPRGFHNFCYKQHASPQAFQGGSAVQALMRAEAANGWLGVNITCQPVDGAQLTANTRRTLTNTGEAYTCNTLCIEVKVD